MQSNAPALIRRGPVRANTPRTRVRPSLEVVPANGNQSAKATFDATQEDARATPANANGDVLTVPEVARLLRIGRNAVYEGCARGEIPHVRVGRLLRFPRAAIMRWLSSCSSQVAKEQD